MREQISRLLVIVLCLLVVVAPARAQSHGPRQRPEAPQLVLPTVSASMTDDEIAAALNTWFAGYAAGGQFSGVALVARGGREIFAGAYGEADRAAHAANGADTRFSTASIGKAFTHVAILQLVEAGRLSLTTTLGEVIPDYPNASARVATIEQLLTHRGGISDIFGPAFREAPKDRFTSNAAYYAFVSQQPQMFTPGAREEYCNGCYIVLGEIIARVSGLSYEDYIAQRIFAPAGMTRSGFFRNDQLPTDSARFYGSPRGPGGEIEDVSAFHGVAGNGAGGAYATARDLLAFDNAVREHRLLNAESAAHFLRGAPETGRATARIGRAGGGPGVNGMLMGDGAWTVILLTNRDPPFAETAGPQVFSLFAGPART